MQRIAYKNNNQNFTIIIILSVCSLTKSNTLLCIQIKQPFMMFVKLAKLDPVRENINLFLYKWCSHFDNFDVSLKKKNF